MLIYFFIKISRILSNSDVSSSTCISLSLTLVPFLGNPTIAGKLNKISVTLPGASADFRIFRQFHVLINSFKSAWITGITLKAKTFLWIADEGLCIYHMLKKIDPPVQFIFFKSWPKWFNALISCWFCINKWFFRGREEHLHIIKIITFSSTIFAMLLYA